MGAFDVACEVLRDELRRVEYNIRDMNMTHADSGKWLKREEDREDSLKAAIAVLTAAEKVDGKAGIKEMGDLIIAAQQAARAAGSRE